MLTLSAETIKDQADEELYQATHYYIIDLPIYQYAPIKVTIYQGNKVVDVQETQLIKQAHAIGKQAVDYANNTFHQGK